MNRTRLIAIGCVLFVFLVMILYHGIKCLQFCFRLRRERKRYETEIARLRTDHEVMLRALTDSQNINVVENRRLTEENAALLEKTRKQEATILTLQSAPDKQDKIELQSVRETLEKMYVTVPGFSAAWLTAYKDVREKNEREMATGLKAFVLKCLPRKKDSAALPPAKQDDTGSES